MNLPYAFLTIDPRSNKPRPLTPYEIIGTVPDPNNPANLLPYRVSGATNPDGYALESVPIGGKGTVRLYGAAGFAEVTYSKVFVDQQGVTDTLKLVQSGVVVGVPRIIAAGRRFVTDTGLPWRMAGVDGMRDLQRELAGEDLRRLREQTVEAGGNCRRRFLMYSTGFVTNDGTGAFIPQSFGARFFDALEDSLELDAEHNLYSLGVAFAGTQNVMPRLDDQLQFWDRLGQIARRHSNFIPCLVNEQGQHDNSVDIWAFPPIDGVMFSFGSCGAGGNPPDRVGPFAELHSERGKPAEVTTSSVYYAVNGYKGENGQPDYPGTGVVTVVTEPLGIADYEQPGRRTNRPDACYQMGLGCQQGATDGDGGGIAHPENGIQSIPLSDIQFACVKAQIRGMLAR